MLSLFICLLAFLSTETVHSSAAAGVIDATHRYAWSENVGWIDFGTIEGNVQITDAALTGYAWGENVGWISLNCANTASCGTVDYKVTNNGEGTLGGYAWSENLGWIQFDPPHAGVRIDASGTFSGYAWGENIGWIVFHCNNQNSCDTADFKVRTDWRPLSGRANEAAVPTALSGGCRGSNCRNKPTPTIDRLPAASPVLSSRTLPPAPTGIVSPVRERLAARIESRITQNPRLRAFLLRVLERLDRRLAAHQR